MTQAFNLALLANKVNSSGLLDASTALTNAVPVANGGLALTSIAAKSIPVANSANTYTTVTPAAGQSVRINAGNTAWEAFTPGTGTVTSVATGNGLTGGTITSSGTISLDYYSGSSSTNSSYPIGSYVVARDGGSAGYPSRNGSAQINFSSSDANQFYSGTNNPFGGTQTTLAGTWRSRGGLPTNACNVGYLTFQRTA